MTHSFAGMDCSGEDNVLKTVVIAETSLFNGKPFDWAEAAST